MSIIKILNTQPLISIEVPHDFVCEVVNRQGAANQSKNITFTKFKRTFDRDYVGKYCLVDWLDDNAIIDCSLIHEWD